MMYCKPFFIYAYLEAVYSRSFTTGNNSTVLYFNFNPMSYIQIDSISEPPLALLAWI